jgi:DNA-binding MarR family transcriptional regulator
MGRAFSRLQRELRQSKPFRSIYQEAALSILKTASVARLAITRRLEPEGVTAQQYNVLRILGGAGEAGLPTLAIAERLVEEAPGMTRLIDRLESHGWVRRERSAEDRRQVVCRITGEGAGLLKRLAPRVHQLDEEFERTLSPEEAERLTELLEKIREGLDDGEGKGEQERNL